jgi:hypothetical protein
MTLTDEDRLEQLVSEYRYVQLALGQLKEQESDVKARLRDALGDARGAVELHGKPALTVTYRKVFDPQQAVKVLDQYELDLITERTVIASVAKSLLAPARYAACQVESATPTITLAKDAS